LFPKMILLYWNANLKSFSLPIVHNRMRNSHRSAVSAAKLSNSDVETPSYPSITRIATFRHQLNHSNHNIVLILSVILSNITGSFVISFTTYILFCFF
jgi:hypothetical protein